jgi:uracil phosphoribosyltransferase
MQNLWTKFGKNGYELNLNISKVLLSALRDQNTKQKEFIETSNRLFTILLELSLSDQPLTTATHTSGTGTDYEHFTFKNPKLCLVPILRSGEAICNMGRLLTADVAVASILIQRDESKPDKPAIYLYKKIPKDIAEREIYLVDPMLATGGSSVKALEVLEEAGANMEEVRFVNLVSCPEGLERVSERFPGVKVFTAAVDFALDENKYIQPGLGDFGDRYYGTG